jgi:putative PIN family toxin of toxin-antitoxin system
VPRAVLDPNVLVSALLTPDGASAQLLVELGAGAFEIVMSPFVSQLREILRREKFRRYLTESEGDAYVQQVQLASVVVEDLEPAHDPLCDDPDDEYLIALARAAGASLVSGDRHLTELRGVIPVLTPVEFLDSLRSS